MRNCPCMIYHLTLTSSKRETDKKGDKNSTYGAIERKNGDRRYDPPLPMSVQKEKASKKKDLYGRNHIEDEGKRGSYDPPLPVSVQKAPAKDGTMTKGSIHYHDPETGKRLPDAGSRYNPPLPTSVQKESKEVKSKNIYHDKEITHYAKRKGNESSYDPPLPTSVQKEIMDAPVYGTKDRKTPIKQFKETKVYEPPLPTSVQKEEIQDYKCDSELYGDINRKVYTKRKNSESAYDPPLPTSVQKEVYGDLPHRGNYTAKEKASSVYEPPLPTSVQKEDNELIYGKNANWGKKNYTAKERAGSVYDPPLPTSVQRTQTGEYKAYTVKDSTYGKDLKVTTNYKGRQGSESCYEPPLPTSVQSPDDPELEEDDTFLLHRDDDALPSYAREDLINRFIHPDVETDYLNEEHLPNSVLEIKSQKGKHSTQKPLDLMKWCLKYFSKEGDIVLDNTMGSGSTGVACKEMNRSFIGIEMNPEIFEVACDRILD